MSTNDPLTPERVAEMVIAFACGAAVCLIMSRLIEADQPQPPAPASSFLQVPLGAYPEGVIPWHHDPGYDAPEPPTPSVVEVQPPDEVSSPSLAAVFVDDEPPPAPSALYISDVVGEHSTTFQIYDFGDDDFSTAPKHPRDYFSLGVSYLTVKRKDGKMAVKLWSMSDNRRVQHYSPWITISQ